MTFQEFTANNIKNFEELRTSSSKDTSMRTFEVRIADRYSNFVSMNTQATSVSEALNNIVYRAVKAGKLKFPNVNVAIGTIRKDPFKYQVKIRDTKYEVTFKDSVLKRFL